MTNSVLVKKQGGWPTGPDDGLILALDTGPEPGQAHEVVDPDVLPGEVWHYAVFVSGEDAEDWQLDVVEGENADQGGVPFDDPEPTGDDTGEGEDPETVVHVATPTIELILREAQGCGCTSSSRAEGLSGLLLVGILGLLRRREERT